jgi:CYTH domain-containing protein
MEGYFSHSAERSHLVRIEDASASLVLVVRDEFGHVHKDATAVSHSQAQALLEVAAGRVTYDRRTLTLAPGVEGTLERILTPSPTALLSVSFDTPAEAAQFEPPLWVGPEVSADSAFDTATIALLGQPSVADPEISNAPLEALLDVLDTRPDKLEPAEPSRHAAE